MPWRALGEMLRRRGGPPQAASAAPPAGGPIYELTDHDDLQRNARSGWRSGDAARRQHRAYGAVLADMYAGRPRRDLRVAARAVESSGIPNPSVLEVGCGSGYYSVVLAHLLQGSPRYVGMDVSPQMIDLAHRCYPSVPFVVADAEALPFRDASFDVVLNGVSLMHVPNFGAAIRESRRVSRNLAVFHTVPVTSERPTTALRHLAYGQVYLEFVFNELALRRELEGAGLRIRDVHDSIPYDLSGVVGVRTSARTFVCEHAE